MFNRCICVCMYQGSNWGDQNRKKTYFRRQMRHKRHNIQAPGPDIDAEGSFLENFAQIFEKSGLKCNKSQFWEKKFGFKKHFKDTPRESSRKRVLGGQLLKLQVKKSEEKRHIFPTFHYKKTQTQVIPPLFDPWYVYKLIFIYVCVDTHMYGCMCPCAHVCV